MTGGLDFFAHGCEAAGRRLSPCGLGVPRRDINVDAASLQGRKIGVAEKPASADICAGFLPKFASVVSADRRQVS